MQATIDKIARLFALLGGAMLSTLIILTCLSILGRSINSILHSDALQSIMPELAATLLATGIGPINGDFELVEAGMAFAIFAFIPLCQLQSAHASVDIFTSRLPKSLNRALRMLVEVTFAAILILIAWQLCQGMLSKKASGQTTFLLQFPLWWAYAVSLTGAIVSALVAIYVAAMRIREVATGQTMLPTEWEGEP